jgi:Cof subfamily protein (haloacid dehalogenase superfamily)
MIVNGLNFSVATARSLASTEKIMADVNLNVPIILMNGALVHDMKQKRYIKVNRLPPKTVQDVIKSLKIFEITGFMYEFNNGELMTYYESLEQKPLHDFVQERISRYSKSFQHIDNFSAISLENIVSFTLLDTSERLQPVHETFLALSGLNSTFYKDNYSPDLWYLEISSPEKKKKNAVSYLREKFGFEQIIGFGDNFNDLSMFEVCDVRIAVGNAQPEVKAAAEYICDVNDNNGVVKWMEENYYGG